LAGICLLLVTFALRLEAQVTASLQGGVVHGLVRDAGSGQPVPLALVRIPARDLRLFTSESGRFSLPGLAPGDYDLEIRQIGYAPATFRLKVVAAGAGAAQEAVVLSLIRQALVLPTVAVNAPVCTRPKDRPADPAARAVLDQLVTNAERLLTMERTYPVLARFERATIGLDGRDSALTLRWDSVETISDHIEAYRHGRVMRARPGRSEQIRCFTTSDIARSEFRDRHCFWVIGEMVQEGERLLRIDFAPVSRDRATDWAGSLYLDTSGLLRRSEASLVNIPLDSPRVRASRCEVTYTEIIPTLLHEMGLECRTEHEGFRTEATREVWGLLSWRFTGRVPGR
jgi:hypothetical protein